MINMSRARPDTMNTYMKNLPREKEREEGGGGEITGTQKLDSCILTFEYQIPLQFQ
jgi:hypothetical protein